MAFVDGTPASFCLGALRGDRASIRGEGTAPGFRRSGLGRLVLEQTLEALAAAGARTVTLEVLNGNDAAVGLYRRSGFEQRRRLLGYRLARPGRGLRARLTGGLAECDTDTAIDRLTRWGWHDPPWQLEPESLAHLPALALDGSVPCCSASGAADRSGCTRWRSTPSAGARGWRSPRHLAAPGAHGSACPRWCRRSGGRRRALLRPGEPSTRAIGSGRCGGRWGPARPPVMV